MKQIITIVLALSSVMGFAQEDYNGRVGINTNEPKATLHVKEFKATTNEEKKLPQGITLPMLSTNQRALFENTIAGTTIYNTTTKCIEYYNGTDWVCLEAPVSPSPFAPTSPLKGRAKVWDRTVYIASFNHSGVTIDGQLNNTNRLVIQIPYNEAVGSYNGMLATQSVIDRDGVSKDLTLHIFPGTFVDGKGFISAEIIVGNGTDDVYKIPYIAENTESPIATFTFSLNGRTSTVKLIASGGVLDKNFTKANYKFIYIPVSAYVDQASALPDSGEPYEKKWLNNNLGANYARVGNNQHTKQATSYDDHNAYGSLFQWQRPADGHELVNWTSTTTGTPSDITTTLWDNVNWTPNHSKFIPNDNISEISWIIATINTDPAYQNFWQSGGATNPCPQGYHPPTHSEWETFHYSMGGAQTFYYWSTQNTLHLPAAGGRSAYNGALFSQGRQGRYWSSSSATVDGLQKTTHGLTFRDNHSEIATDYRAAGQSVRCTAD